MHLAKTIISCSITLLLSACLHPLSPEARSAIDKELTLEQIGEDPSSYLGRSLMLGGTILSLESDNESSTLEILEWQLNYLGEPYVPSSSGRRFLLVTRQHLAPEIYDRGRLVTLTGALRGSEDRRLLSGATYTYPVFALGELHLWETPFRYGISSYQDPATPNYIGPEEYGRDHPYDPGFNTFPYTPYWYRVPYP